MSLANDIADAVVNAILASGLVPSDRVTRSLVPVVDADGLSAPSVVVRPRNRESRPLSRKSRQHDYVIEAAVMAGVAVVEDDVPPLMDMCEQIEAHIWNTCATIDGAALASAQINPLFDVESLVAQKRAFVSVIAFTYRIVV